MTFRMRALSTLLLLGALTGCSSLCIRTPGDFPFLDVTVPRGQSLQFKAGGTDILGECEMPGPAKVRWRSSDSTIATVDSSGTARGLSPGKATIIARAGWRKATWKITVVPAVARLTIQPRDTTIAAGDTVWFRAVALDSAGNVIPNARIALQVYEVRTAKVTTTYRPGIGQVHFFGQDAPTVPLNTLPVKASRPATGFVIAGLIGARDSVRVSALLRTSSLRILSISDNIDSQ